MEKKGASKGIVRLVVFAVLIVALLASIGMNVYLAFFGYDSYLQSTDEIYIMEAGILKNNLAFREGSNHEFTYDFTHQEYPELREKYEIERIAGEGTEFERALSLMDEFAPRLTHESYYDNHVEMNALALLEYSLDNRSQGINCRCKAQILNEMSLSLGLYARKVWIMPNSKYDTDCHVVNEVWDTSLKKWVMLDITNNEYWVDEAGTPLSVLEIRHKGAMQEFCTPVVPGESLSNLQKLKEKHIGDFLYIMKNMTYMEYCADYTVGESKPFFLLFPENLDTNYEWILSKECVEASPVQ